MSRKIYVFLGLVILILSLVYVDIQNGISSSWKGAFTKMPFRNSSPSSLSNLNVKQLTKLPPSIIETRLGPESLQKPDDFFANSVGHGTQQISEYIFEKYPLGPPLPSKQGPAGSDDAETQEATQCSSSALRSSQGKDLIDYLVNHTSNCLFYLWTFDENLRASYTSANILTVLSEITARAPLFDNQNDHGLNSLLLYVRTANYHSAYDKFVLADDVRLAMGPPAFALIANEHYFSASDVAGDIVSNSTFLWEQGAAHQYFDTIIRFLTLFRNHPDRLKIYEQQIVLHRMMTYIQNKPCEEPSFATRINDATLELLEFFIFDKYFVDDYVWVINNSIFAVGRINKCIESLRSVTMDILTRAYTTYAFPSEPWLWVVRSLGLLGGECQVLTNGTSVCIEEVKKRLKDSLFPNTYVFEDGAFVVRTPLLVDRVQMMYHASQEVSAQFSRITETIVPLKNDPNGIMTVILYGNRDDYKRYQTFLYDLPSNNGGIYIEPWGTFFTYDRPDTNAYTLEELFRHEFSHYLVGRYLIPGMWGETPIYENRRMHWFDEGFAEFLTGSSRANNILPRKNLVEKIKSDGTGRMHLYELFTPGHTDFRFYKYAGTFFHYLYIQDPNQLRNFVQYVHESNVAAFDSSVEKIKKNRAIDIKFQKYIDELIVKITELNDPFTAVPQLTLLTENDPLSIQTPFQQLRLGSNAKCSLSAKSINSRFSCRGALTGSKSPTARPKEEVWSLFNQNLNEMINTITNVANNFGAMVCRFGPIEFFNHGESVVPRTDYYCEGPLGENNLSLMDRLEQVTIDFHNVSWGIFASCTKDNQQKINCRVPLQTGPYPETTDSSVLQAELASMLQIVHRQVYATRPSFYRSFLCEMQSGTYVKRTHRDFPGKYYMSGTGECTVQ